MKPQHFHLGAALVLGMFALAAAIAGYIAIGAFIALGAFVALLHWKVAKSGVID